MSQEKKTKDSAEARKKILLGVLFLVMIVVVYFQFFYDDSGPTQPGSGSSAVNTANKPSPTPTPRPQALGQKPEQIITQPLELAWTGKVVSGDGTGRNIFVYPTPTPIPVPTPGPPPPTPVPPPVLLSSVNPSGVIGRTGEFTMTLYGDKFPADGQGFLDGRPYESKFISPTELRVQIPSEAIRNAGNMGVQVRSRADAAMYSNQLSLNVAEPPAPPYRFIGYLTRKNEIMAVLNSQSDENEVFNVKKGGTIGTHWRVINITQQKIELEDTNLKIAERRYVVHTINYTGDGK